MSQTLGAQSTHLADRVHVPWRYAGLLMALSFAFLQLLNEIGALMVIPFYGAMSHDLSLTSSQVTWAVLATTLASAVSIALLAKAGDLFGHRRVMIACVLLIIVGYVVSMVATNLATLIIGRALIGVIAGQALCVGIMNDRLSVDSQKRAVTIIASGQAVGIFLGFALSGLFVEAGLSWRAAFLTCGVLTAISLAGFMIWGRDSDARQRNAGREVHLDVVGVGLMGVGLTALCIAISQSMTWNLVTVLAIAAAGLVLLAISLAWESRSKHPLLDLSELCSRRLFPAYCVTFAIGIPGMLMYNSAMTFAQLPAPVGLGMNPLKAACVFIPQFIAGLLVAKSLPRILSGLAAKFVIIAATLIMGATYVTLAFGHTNIIVLCVGIFFFGFAHTALWSTSLGVVTTEAKSGKAAGTASVYVALLMAATSVGTAIYAALASWGTDPVTHALESKTFTAAFLIGASCTVIGVIAGSAMSRDLRISQAALGH